MIIEHNRNDTIIIIHVSIKLIIIVFKFLHELLTTNLKKLL